MDSDDDDESDDDSASGDYPGTSRKAYWGGFGVSAMFQVDWEFNSLAAPYLFKVSQQFVSSSGRGS